MDQKQQLESWLRDAHAMEVNLQGVLTRHIAAAADLPVVCQRLEEHREQTKQHALLVEECLGMLGTTPSAMKSVAGGLMGMLEGMSTGIFRDQILKNLLADYAMEHLEIGCYSALIAAAETLNYDEIAQRCSWILRDEAAMAGWIEEQIPVAARFHLQSQAAA